MSRFRFPFFKQHFSELKTAREELCKELRGIEKILIDHQEFRGKFPALYERFIKFNIELLTGNQKTCDLIPTEKNWHRIAIAKSVQEAIIKNMHFFDNDSASNKKRQQEIIKLLKEIEGMLGEE